MPQRTLRTDINGENITLVAIVADVVATAGMTLRICCQQCVGNSIKC
jgi:hypothetical protein